MHDDDSSPSRSALLLLGPTGSGKSPLGDLLEMRGLDGRRCAHFDFGANLRSVDSTGALASTGKILADLSDTDRAVIRESLATGALLENEHFPIAASILLGFAESRQMTATDLLILNGLPRHVGQAHDLDQYVDVTHLIVLDSSAKVIQQRIRRNSGGDRGERIDDDTSLVERKLVTFRERTAPLIDHYAALGARVQRLDVGIETVAQDLLALL